MKILDFSRSIIYWTLTQFRNIIDAFAQLTNLPSPNKRGDLKAHKKKIRELKLIIFSSIFKLLGFSGLIFSLYFAISPLTNLATNILFFLWNYDAPFARGVFRAGFSPYLMALGTGVLVAIFNSLTGNRKVVVEPSDHNYLVLLKTVYRVLGEIAPVTRLYPPGYSEGLKPETWFRIFNNMPVYIYACPHKGINIDISKICRLFSTELRRQQRDSQVSSESLAILIDYTIDRDYIYFELILDAESKLAKELAVNLDKKIRRAQLNQKPAQKVDDDEF